MNLKPQHEYDLVETLYSGQAFRWSPLNQAEDDMSAWHEAIIGDQRIRLRQIKDEIQVEEHGASAPNFDLISKYLRLEDNLSEIYSDLCTDKYLQKATITKSIKSIHKPLKMPHNLSKNPHLYPQWGF